MSDVVTRINSSKGGHSSSTGSGRHHDGGAEGSQNKPRRPERLSVDADLDIDIRNILPRSDEAARKAKRREKSRSKSSKQSALEPLASSSTASAQPSGPAEAPARGALEEEIKEQDVGTSKKSGAEGASTPQNQTTSPNQEKEGSRAQTPSSSSKPQHLQKTPPPIPPPRSRSRELL